MATKVLINAGAGRMGKRILALLLEDPELQLAGVSEMAGHPAQGQDAGTLIGVNDLGVKVMTSQEDPATEPEVVLPTRARELTRLCQNGAPNVTSRAVRIQPSR